jgi:entry exclusion lipoprotein TrbK
MKKTLLIAALMAALTGCEKQSPLPVMSEVAPVMPEVNDANCQRPKIMEIKDKATREAFAGKCARYSPTGGDAIRKTPNPKNWLDLIDPPNPKGQGAKP